MSQRSTTVDEPLLPNRRTTMVLAATPATAGALTVAALAFAPVSDEDGATRRSSTSTPAYAVMPPTAPFPVRSPTVAEAQFAVVLRIRQVYEAASVPVETR